jgi:hypothetical protein
MFPLDPKTVHRLVEVIVSDGDGQYERKSWQLSELLANAGWSDPPEFDGGSRGFWLKQQMTARQDDRVAIERLLCRVCDPLEYDGGEVDAEAFRKAVNERLRHEGLEVIYAQGRPILVERSEDGDGTLLAEPPELEQRIRALVQDQAIAAVLNRRVAETRICQRGGAHTMAIIAIGGLVEGLLLALLSERDPEARAGRFVDRERRRVRNRQPGLEMLIDTVYENGWIQLDARKFIHEVRDFRNFIHPRKELAEQPAFDADSVRLCWSPVHAMLNDLENALAGRSQGGS